MRQDKPTRRTVTLPPLPPHPEGERGLRDILRRTLQAALVPGLALGLACTGEGETQPLSSCQNGAWNPAAALTPAALTDYVALLRQWDPPIQPSPSQRLDPAREEGAVGQPCKTAVGMQVCLDTLAVARKSEGASQLVLVATQGDRVVRIDAKQQLLEFLGIIDSDADAALRAYFDGYRSTCQEAEPVKIVRGGFEVQVQGPGVCGGLVDGYVVFVSAGGEVTIRKQPPSPNVVCGRRCDGVQLAETGPVPGTLAGLLTQSAALEAGSVHAFHQLQRDLRRLKAPRSLVSQAGRAAVDEVRHARTMAALARRHDATARAPRVDGTAPKDLAALTLENAVEGCVRETFGAVVAGYQGRAAGDPHIARAMTAIAKDETRHALLAWRIARWAEPQLGTAQRRKIQEHRRAAVAELHAAADVVHDRAVHAVAGWPEAAAAHAIVNALDADLWQRAS